MLFTPLQIRARLLCRGEAPSALKMSLWNWNLSLFQYYTLLCQIFTGEFHRKRAV
jgi:hypothetical protein